MKKLLQLASTGLLASLVFIGMTLGRASFAETPPAGNAPGGAPGGEHPHGHWQHHELSQEQRTALAACDQTAGFTPPTGGDRRQEMKARRQFEQGLSKDKQEAWKNCRKAAFENGKQG